MYWHQSCLWTFTNLYRNGLTITKCFELYTTIRCLPGTHCWDSLRDSSSVSTGLIAS